LKLFIPGIINKSEALEAHQEFFDKAVMLTNYKVFYQKIYSVRYLKAIEARGVYETMKRCRQYASQIFKYAMASGIGDNDPTIPIVGSLKTKKVSHHKSFGLEDLPKFINSIELNKPRLYRQTYPSDQPRIL
jgi:hypothetical protein